MANLMTSASTWSTGTIDTATSLQDGVDEKRAAHINGPASAIIGLETKLGDATALVGSKTDLATRLDVHVRSDGTIWDVADIKMSGRATAQDGWLLCDGTAVSRSTFADLFTAISTTYGAGDGSTTFNVPDMRGRMPLGPGTGVGNGASGSGQPSGGSSLSTRSRGNWGGVENVLLSDEETPLRAHAHAVTADTGNSSSAAVTVGWLLGANDHGQNVIGTSTGAMAPSVAHQNMTPFTCVNFIIKY